MSYNSIPNDRQLSIVFLGCGNITNTHSKNARKADKKILLSYASRTLSKAEDYVKKHKGHLAFGSYDEAINSAEIDVVMINTPPNSHFKLAQKAINAGKHVIIEKPPFFQASDFDILGPKSDAAGLQLLVAENYYYRPMRAQVAEAIKSGAIGTPLFIQINATKKQKSKGDWREDKSLTGYGALYEGGIHWANFINNIGLDVTTVTGYQPIKDVALERSMQVTAETKQGAVINLLYSWEVDTLLFGLRLSRVYGTEGSITFESNGVLTIIRGNKKSIKLPSISKITGGKPMWQDFIKAIKSGEKAKFDWKMAKQDLLFVEKAYGID